VDLATAACFAVEEYDAAEPLTTGTGEDITIAELAGVVARIVGYREAIRFAPSKPNGAPRKLLDVSRRATMGWRARIGLVDGTCALHLDQS
jgi:GDP-L-fucose synthase